MQKDNCKAKTPGKKPTQMTRKLPKTPRYQAGQVISEKLLCYESIKNDVKLTGFVCMGLVTQRLLGGEWVRGHTEVWRGEYLGGPECGYPFHGHVFFPLPNAPYQPHGGNNATPPVQPTE